MAPSAKPVHRRVAVRHASVDLKEFMLPSPLFAAVAAPFSRSHFGEMTSELVHAKLLIAHYHGLRLLRPRNSADAGIGQAQQRQER
jgi:hypothetical protein